MTSVHIMARPRADAGPASNKSKVAIIERAEKLTMTQPTRPRPCEPGERPSTKVAAASPIRRAPTRRGQKPVSIRGSPRTPIVARGESASRNPAESLRSVSIERSCCKQIYQSRGLGGAPTQSLLSVGSFTLNGLLSVSPAKMVSNAPSCSASFGLMAGV
jgi:hypothetical protein